MAIDFALLRFRHYLLGPQREIIVVTNHKPPNIFNGRRKRSIQTEQVRQQNIYFSGSRNTSDYLSCHVVPLRSLSQDIQNEAEELNN